MGADLIAFVTKGPEELSVSEEAQKDIVNQVMETKEVIVATAEDLIVDSEADVDFSKLPDMSADRSLSIPLPVNNDFGEQPKTRKELRGRDDARDMMFSVLSQTGLARFAHLVRTEREDVESAVEDFLGLWNGEVRWRNVTMRQDPDNPEQKIVVAGELSSGEKPEGGYEVMERAFSFGIAQTLGCR
jgi:hypothetical protein